MFWGKKSAKEEGKLSRPKAIPGLVQNYLVAERKMDPDLVKLLKAVERKSATEEKAFNIRVFDDSEAIAKKVEVKDYTSLDECPDLIIYEGWFDEGAKQVKLEEKKKVNWDTPIFTRSRDTAENRSAKGTRQHGLLLHAAGSATWRPPRHGCCCY